MTVKNILLTSKYPNRRGKSGPSLRELERILWNNSGTAYRMLGVDCVSGLVGLNNWAQAIIQFVGNGKENCESGTCGHLSSSTASRLASSIIQRSFDSIPTRTKMLPPSNGLGVRNGLLK